MKYCDECGAELSDEMQFCDSCGAEQEESDTQPLSEKKIIKQPNLKGSKEVIVRHETPKKSGGKVIAVVFAILIIIGAGLGAYYYFFMSDNAIYEKALELYNEQNYDEALPLLESLRDYSNSADLVLEINNELKYKQAFDEETSGNVSEAIKLFSELGEYKDSRLKAEVLSKGVEFGVYDSEVNGEWVADIESINALNSNIFEGESKITFNSDGTAEVTINGKTINGNYSFTEKEITIENQTINRIQSDSGTAYLEIVIDEGSKLIFKMKNNDSSYISEMPELSTGVARDKAVTAYEDFITNEEFKSIIDSNVSFVGAPNYKYVVHDIREDGVPELIIVAGTEPEWNQNFFFNYNEETGAVELFTDFRTYGNIQYSQENKAVVFTDLNPYGGMWQQDFYTLNEENKFEEKFYLYSDGGNSATLVEGEKETVLTEIESSAYFNELTDFNFTEISVEQAVQEITSIQYNDPNNGQYLKLFSDGTFELYVAAYSTMAYVYGTYWEIDSVYNFNVTSNTLDGVIGHDVTSFSFDTIDSNTLMFSNFDQIGALTNGTFFYL